MLGAWVRRLLILRILLPGRRKRSARGKICAGVFRLCKKSWMPARRIARRLRMR